MRKYRIYLLALLLSIASQSLLAIDGYWEKIETKNSPSPRYAYTLINISDGKVLLIGGKSPMMKDKDSIKQMSSEFWLFDYGTKDWTKLELTIPDYLYDSYSKHNPDEIFCKLRENKLIAYFNDKITVTYDSSTWYLDLESLSWVKINNTGYTLKYILPKMCNLKDSVILQYSIDDSGTGSMFTFIFSEKNMRWKRYETPDDTSYFRKVEGAMINIADGKCLYYGGRNPSWVTPEDQDMINYWLFDYSKLKWTKLTARSYELYEDKKYKFITNSNPVKLFDNVAFIAKGTYQTFYGPKVNDTTFLIDVKNKVFNKYLKVENEPVGARAAVMSELQRGKAIMFGTAEINTNTTITNLINDTWVFHADESLSVEQLDGKAQQIKKVFVEDKLLITQDLLDNRQILNVNLFNLLGAEVVGIEIEGNEIKFNCEAGTYLLQLKLNNNEFINYIIIKK